MGKGLGEGFANNTKVCQHSFPYPIITPASKAFVRAIPVAEFSRQQAPLRPTATYPLHSFDETTALCLVSHIGMRVWLQEIPLFRPLIIS
jgi:hypothetical protein